jgi:hypothetical protein
MCIIYLKANHNYKIFHGLDKKDIILWETFIFTRAFVRSYVNCKLIDISIG